MRGRSVVLNVLTLLALAATGCVVVAVVGLFVLPSIFGEPLGNTQPVQVSLLTAMPTPAATATPAYPTLPPQWTATPSQQPSPSDTTGPTATPATPATSTASPSATHTLAPSTPTATATMARVVKINAQANVRSGPSTAYPVVSRLQSSQTAPVVGRDSSGNWFAITFDGAPGGIGWVSTLASSYAGSIGDLPVIQAAGPPPATAIPATNTPPAATSAPTAIGANGIQTLDFHMEQTSGSINQDMWFDFKVLNTTGSTITYGILAAHTDAGVTADSWHEPLLPGREKDWRDHIDFPNTGTYQVYLGICYASHDACKSGGAAWTHLSNSTTVTIQ